VNSDHALNDGTQTVSVRLSTIALRMTRRSGRVLPGAARGRATTGSEPRARPVMAGLRRLVT
jgi:hypothetical protein